MCREIENITDQLLGFTEEVASVVERMEERSFSRQEALRLTELGIEDIKAEVEHQRTKKMSLLIESIELLGDRIVQAVELFCEYR